MVIKFRRSSVVFIFVIVFVLFSLISASDIVHNDISAPKSPGCTNGFVLVKVQLWIDGKEENEMIGLGAQFGKTLEAHEKNANKSKLVILDPTDGCIRHKNQLSQEVVLVHRGICDFTTKAKLAQDAGASAVLVENNETALFKMGCSDSETALQIRIPTVVLPRDAGQILEEHLKGNLSVQLQLYSPKRPLFDVAEFFLWLLALGTIICASYWSAWSAREASMELEKLLQDGSNDYENTDTSSSGVVEINTLSAVLFVVFASCFLFLLYKCMNPVFIKGLVVLFCIGGMEGLQTCLAAVLYRWFRKAGDTFINVPYIGSVSHLTLGVSPLCIVFAVVWAVKRDISFAWIGQDILGIALIITVLQIVRVPNLKVGCVLLGCSFLYDVFWVFTPKNFLKESVMIVVAQSGTTSGDGIPMLLKIPHINDPWGGFSVVGFGDIILPGLVIAFSLRFVRWYLSLVFVLFCQKPPFCRYDWLSNRSFRAGYFVWAMTAYGSGLLLTYVALAMMDGHGQPALLYIAPLTLGSLLILGKGRGELATLWERGEPYRACPHMHHQHSEEMCGNEGCGDMKLE